MLVAVPESKVLGLWLILSLISFWILCQVLDGEEFSDEIQGTTEELRMSGH